MDATAEGELFIILATGVIGMLILACAIIIFVLVYQRRILSQQVQMNNLESQHKNALLMASIQTQEVERKRISKDLHDDIGVLLSIAKLYLNQVLEQKDNARDELLVKKSVTLIENTIKGTRRLIDDLMPVSLEKFGLTSAIEELCITINGLKRVEADFSSELIPRFAAQKEIALYRIVKELLHNSVKYANANNITVLLRRLDDDILLFYSDDGIGFDYEKAKQNSAQNGGNGLLNIQIRVQFLNGKLRYKTALGKGVRVEIVFHKIYS